MNVIRPIIGACVLLAMFAAAALGVWLLYETEGGGVAFSVTFKDARNLEPGSNLIYQDQNVGRVVSVRRDDGLYIIDARLSSRHAELLHERSRFWVQDPLGKSLLCFDNPKDCGPPAGEGARFTGLEARPAPEFVPPPKPRQLDARPAWLCEVRVTATLMVGDNVKDERRKSAAAVLQHEGGPWVLAPAWVWRFEGEIRTRQAYVEFAGGETKTAEVEREQDGCILLRVSSSTWQGKAAALWLEPLAAGQGVAAMNFKGEFFPARLKGEVLEGMGMMEGGYAVCVDGVKLAGFALPPRGGSEPRFVVARGMEAR